MTQHRSTVVSGSDPSLGDVFPTYVVEPERLVFEYVRDATNWRAVFPEEHPGLGFPIPFDTPPTVELYEGRGDDRSVPVVRGWPTYPGQIPAIGVALGNESEDRQAESLGGGFAGDATLWGPPTFPDDDQALTFAFDGSGINFRAYAIGSAAYYSEPMYTVIVVELIHENRDERDRLHELLRPILFGLRRRLPGRSRLIFRASLDAEKQELPLDEQPQIIYASIFTVHVWSEMLEAVDVIGPDGQLEHIDVSLTFQT